MLALCWGAALHAGSLKAGEPCAPSRLMDTGLYAAGRPGVVDGRNRPFSPQYPPWADGAARARWIFLPEGSSIDTNDPALSPRALRPLA
jgi:hypothetical protein